MKRYIVGIDGGGTKMKLKAFYADMLLSAEPAEPDKHFPAETVYAAAGVSESGGSNLTAESEEKVRGNLRELFRDLFDNHGLHADSCACVCLGTAGATGGARAQKLTGFLKEILPSAHIIVTSDIYTSLYGGTLSDMGIVLNSGTGSFCFGRDENGESCRVGGWGHIISDEGSGYYIGQRVLNAVTKSIDGRGERTSMADMVSDAVGGNTNQDIVDFVHSGRQTKKDIASFALVCEKAFSEHDKVAGEITAGAAAELASMVRPVVRKLGLSDKQVSCVYTGSILTKFEGLRNITASLINSEFPAVRFEPCREDAAWGAVLICLEWLKFNQNSIR
ncbi:MAG: BadF/BadG/BcrA/BcrD ATPase family protein [Eubacteriales bacterium]|nr:BadF/BadG/BcrA/BcrD ATPase family protein [Eubacteriales bacterium]